MQTSAAEKFAAVLAAHAVNAGGKNSELTGHIKQAAWSDVGELLKNPLVYSPLIGTSIGGLAGYYGTDGDEKKKKRNAGYGALTGLLGGFGLPLLAAAGGGVQEQNKSVGAKKDPPTTATTGDAPAPSAPPATAAADDTAGKPTVTHDAKGNPRVNGANPAVSTGGRVLGGTAGFIAGGRPARGLERLLDGPADIERLSAEPKSTGKGQQAKPDPVARAVQDLRAEFARRGNTTAGMLTKPLGQFADRTDIDNSWLKKYVDRTGFNAPSSANLLKKYLAAQQQANTTGAAKPKLTPDIQRAVDDAYRVYQSEAQNAQAVQQTNAPTERIVQRLLRPSIFGRLSPGLGVRNATQNARIAALTELLNAAQKGTKPLTAGQVRAKFDTLKPSLRGRAGRLAGRSIPASVAALLTSPEVSERVYNSPRVFLDWLNSRGGDAPAAPDANSGVRQ